MYHLAFLFFKQKTAYEMRISDWSSDVCSSDLSSRAPRNSLASRARPISRRRARMVPAWKSPETLSGAWGETRGSAAPWRGAAVGIGMGGLQERGTDARTGRALSSRPGFARSRHALSLRSAEHTSELHSLMLN